MIFIRNSRGGATAHAFARTVLGIATITAAGALGSFAAPAAAQAPGVRWLVPPPPVIQGGQQFTVQWEVANFTGALTDNAVAWGVTTLLGQTPSQLNGNCVYTAVVDVPVVPVSGTIFYAAFAQGATEFAFANPIPVLLTPQPAGFTYFPAEPGSSWLYEEISPGSFTYRQTVGPGHQILGCAHPRRFEEFSQGVSGIEENTEYIEARPDGVFFYGFFDGQTVPATETLFDPPVHVLDEQLIVGATVNSAGTATITPTGGPAASLPYTASSTVVAFEPVTVPAGTFDCVKIHLNVTVGGVVEELSDIWLAPGVGIVQSVFMAVPPNQTEVLLHTNLPRP